MIKTAAENSSNPQQSGIGMRSRTGCGAGGAIVTGALGGAVAIAVTVING
jgi:hypothetical protein